MWCRVRLCWLHTVAGSSKSYKVLFKYVNTTYDFPCRYLDVILKQKHISDMATQQLLLDTYNMKAVLTQLPNLTDPNQSHSTGSSGGSSSTKMANSMYLKLVNNKIAHIEMILKLVGTPEDILLERYVCVLVCIMLNFNSLYCYLQLASVLM